MKNYIAIASRPLFYDAATVVYAVKHDLDDFILVGDVCGDIRKIPRWSRIRYNAQGDAYFMHHGRREYLHDYMRVNYPE